VSEIKIYNNFSIIMIKKRLLNQINSGAKRFGTSLELIRSQFKLGVQINEEKFGLHDI
jgi:hypothetical protein